MSSDAPPPSPPGNPIPTMRFASARSILASRSGGSDSNVPSASAVLPAPDEDAIERAAGAERERNDTPTTTPTATANIRTATVRATRFVAELGRLLTVGDTVSRRFLSRRAIQ